MPKGYVIFTEQVHDQAKMDAYAGKAVGSIMAAGGTPIIAGPPADVLEGEWHGTQTVVLEFESVEAARAWYESDEYQAVIGERQAAADSNAVLLAGFDMPG